MILRNIKVLYLILILSCYCLKIFALTAGLKCHECLFVAGQLEYEMCENGKFHKDNLLVDCSIRTVLNLREIQNLTSIFNFDVVCLKAVIKSDKLDMVLRGCYGQKKNLIERNKTSECDTYYDSDINDTSWNTFLEGYIHYKYLPPVGTHSKTIVCTCDGNNGCNSASFTQVFYVTGLLGILMSMRV